jgi:hypothetical protein
MSKKLLAAIAAREDAKRPKPAPKVKKSPAAFAFQGPTK